MSAAETSLRRARMAAATLYRYPDAAARLETRHAAALATAAAALAGADAVPVPGFILRRTPDGIAAERQAPTHADQLALGLVA